MLTKDVVEEVVLEAIKDSTNFLVEVRIAPNGKIVVVLDDDNGVDINDCVRVGRQLNKVLEEKEIDAETEVGSQGLDNPFVLFRQYKKYLSRKVKVKTLEGSVIEGTLSEAIENDHLIIIPPPAPSKTQLKKNPQAYEPIKINFSEIKGTYPVIDFKM